MKKYGAVVTFPEGMSRTEVQEVLRGLQRAVASRRGVEESASISGPYEYDPRYGGPVWYVP